LTSPRASSRCLRLKSTKSKRPRRFQLSRGSIAALQFLREQQAEHKRLFGKDYRDQGLIFAQPNGEFLDPALVSQTIVRRLNKAGITDASLHSLRHSSASLLISRGVPVPAVSARLGHANPSITNRIYSHAIPSDDVRAADEWDTLMGPIH
jgi:integrase